VSEIVDLAQDENLSLWLNTFWYFDVNCSSNYYV
jgi:hypothetical protein